MKEKIHAGAFTALAALLALSTGGAQAVTFSCKPLTDASDTAGLSQMHVSAINNQQQAVGYAWAPGGEFPELGSAMWGKDRKAVRLNDETGDWATYSDANDINDAGQAVGVMWDRVNRMHALVWGTDGSLTSLPGLPNGGDYASASAINGRGKIVGQSRTTLPTGEVVMHATLWTNGVPKDLGALKKKGESSARAINDDGVVVGYSSVPGSDRLVPARWIGGKVAALPVPEGTKGYAVSVNKAGTAVGHVYLASDQRWHAYAWQGDEGFAMGSWPEFAGSWAFAVNAAGVAVGAGHFDGAEFDVALYWPTLAGGAVDLNTLVGPGGCVDAFGVQRTLTGAVDINAKGVIVANAQALVDGMPRSFSFRLAPN